MNAIEIITRAQELVDGEGLLHTLPKITEPKKNPIETRVAVRDLCVGDMIIEIKKFHNHKVVSIDRKAKWATVELMAEVFGVDHGRSTVRVELDIEVDVVRKVADEGELQLSRLNYAVRKIFDQFIKSAPGVVEIDLEDGRWLHSKLEVVAERHARWWEIVGPVLADVGFERENGSKVTFLEALLQRVVELERKVLDGSYRASSSSEWSNLVERTDMKVVLDFLRSGLGAYEWTTVQYSLAEVAGLEHDAPARQLLRWLQSR